MTPKGKLIPIGGAEKRHSRFLGEEDKKSPAFHLEVLSRVVTEIKGENSRIEVITSASSIPEIVGNEYLHSFKNLECEYVGILNLRTKKEVLRKENLRRLEMADALMISGGNQIRLSRSYLGTPFYELLVKRYHEDPEFVIAGTSAGAMIMSDAMIYEGTSKEALLTGKSKITKGFSLLPESLIDSHFVNRNRFGRLMVGVAEYRDFIGIGLAEDTGIIIQEGRYIECIGSGQVHLLDGKNLQIDHINPHDEASHPAHFRNMLSHMLTSGEKFDIQERKFT
ncbi:MAG: cyanophycinase [Bacteroidia bacterium]|nr:cyanophycinase [Bacteroidia bacterium]